MLEAVVVLGGTVAGAKPTGIENYISAAKLRKTRRVLSVVIKKTSYRGISEDDFIPNRIRDYLYSAGAPNGPDRTPASLVTDPERTFRKKIMAWFSKYGDTDDELRTVSQVLSSNGEKIIKDLKLRYNEIRKDERQNILLTIKTSDNEFIGQQAPVRNILLVQFDESTKQNVTGTCMFCAKDKPLIVDLDKPFKSPISDIFSFSTFDKRGFVYGFDPSNSHRQIPICKECYMHLRGGKEWLDRHAFFNFEGYKYYVVVDVNHIAGRNLMKEFVKSAEHFAKLQRRSDDLRYEGKGGKNNLMQEEESLTEYLTGEKVNFTLLFAFVSMKSGGKYMDLMKYVEDVPLTRIRDIFDKYNKVLRSPIFSEESMHVIVSKKWNGDLSKQRGMYLMALVKKFFPADSNHIRFLDMVEKILHGSQVDSGRLLSAFMDTIRQSLYSGKDNPRIVALKSLVLLLLLLKLNLIRNWLHNTSKMSSEDGSIASFTEIFNSHAKMAVFLEGVLVGRLLAIQYAERKSTPFLERLHGLHLSFSETRNLLPRIIGKLREYRQSYGKLETAAANHFLASEKAKESLTPEEASYYFTLGMLIHTAVKP